MWEKALISYVVFGVCGCVIEVYVNFGIYTLSLIMDICSLEEEDANFITQSGNDMEVESLHSILDEDYAFQSSQRPCDDSGSVGLMHYSDISDEELPGNSNGKDEVQPCFE